MLTFYLVRHGNTEHNWDSKTMGQIDSPLTKKGLKNAKVIAKKIGNLTHAYKVSNVVVDDELNYIYSSDLGRAFITAHIIAEKLNVERKLRPSKGLREINYGIHANKKKSQVKKQCPKYKKDASYVFPEGESFYQVQKRVVKFIKRLEKKHKNKTLLLVTHSGVIRGIHCHFHGIDLQDHLNMRFSHEYIGKYIINKGKLISYKKINE